MSYAYNGVLSVCSKWIIFNSGTYNEVSLGWLGEYDIDILGSNMVFGSSNILEFSLPTYYSIVDVG